MYQSNVSFLLIPVFHYLSIYSCIHSFFLLIPPSLIPPLQHTKHSRWPLPRFDDVEIKVLSSRPPPRATALLSSLSISSSSCCGCCCCCCCYNCCCCCCCCCYDCCWYQRYWWCLVYWGRAKASGILRGTSPRLLLLLLPLGGEDRGGGRGISSTNKARRDGRRESGSNSAMLPA